MKKEDRDKLEQQLESIGRTSAVQTTSTYDARRAADQFAAFMAEPE